jgi:formylglycine-generating enzyme required for sulfatase activity
MCIVPAFLPAAWAEDHPARAPVPSSSEVTKARRPVREIFATEYAAAKTSLTARKSLAKELLNRGRQTADDPITRYVLFSEAAETAADAGDMPLMTQAIGEKDKHYAINVIEVTTAILVEAVQSASAREVCHALAAGALSFIQKAIDAEDYASARRLALSAEAAARKSQESDLQDQARSWAKQIRELDREQKKAAEAAQMLQEKPDDADANLNLGRYLCAVKGDWDKGLSMLARGSDPQLKALAEKDLANPSAPEDQVTLGDGWWDQADAAEGVGKPRLIQRAGVWYAKALPSLTGLEQARVQKRLEEHSPASIKDLKLDLGRSVTMDLVLIPPGEFQMGSALPAAELAKKLGGDPGRYAGECRRHPVRITRPFYLGKCEVTQAQWRAVMGNDPSQFKGDDLPVESASWKDCQEFCEKLSKRVHRAIRLPTEAEWEYACRAGTDTVFFFGDSPDRLGEYAWHRYNSNQRTNPVGTRRPNPWGLYDILGNVWEWCSDWNSPYRDDLQIDPTGPSNGQKRLFRGGSWYDRDVYCRPTERSAGHNEDVRNPSIGLRVVAETQ